MGFKRIVKKLFTTVDFFNSSQMLRYQHDSQYRTFTGGLLSIAMIISIILAFANMISDTFQHNIISYTQSIIRNSDPKNIQLIFNKESKNVFGVNLLGYNLNQDYRLFDVFAYEVVCNNGCAQMVYNSIQFQPCSKKNVEFIPEIMNNYDKFMVNNSLCIKDNQKINIGGKPASQQFKRLQIHLKPCSNSTDPNRPCGSTTNLNQYLSIVQKMYFSILTMNAIINPDQKQYIQYYLQDRNILKLSKDIGLQKNMYLNQVTITSDESIFPFQKIKTDKINTISKNSEIYPFKIDLNTSLGTFNIYKDQQQIYITRAVQKLQAVFSFIGGIIGAVLGLLFIINAYTSFSFQLAVAYKVFEKHQNKQTIIMPKTMKQIEQEKMHEQLSVTILDFIKYYLYVFYRWWKNYKHEQQPQENRYPKLEYIYQCRQQILNQLDIKLLMQRIIFLEYSMTFLFQDYQLQAMKLKKPINPQGIRQIRKKMITEDQQKSNMNQKQQIQNETANCLLNDKKGLQSQNISINPKTEDLNDNQNIVDDFSNTKNIQINIPDKNDRKYRADQKSKSKGRIKGTMKSIYNEDDINNKKLAQNQLVIRKKQSNINKDNIIKLVSSVQKGNQISKKILLNMKKDKSIQQQLQQIIIMQKKKQIPTKYI